MRRSGEAVILQMSRCALSTLKSEEDYAPCSMATWSGRREKNLHCRALAQYRAFDCIAGSRISFQGRRDERDLRAHFACLPLHWPSAGSQNFCGHVVCLLSSTAPMLTARLAARPRPRAQIATYSSTVTSVFGGECHLQPLVGQWNRYECRRCPVAFRGCMQYPAKTLLLPLHSPTSYFVSHLMLRSRWAYLPVGSSEQL